jgi:hypothetical protein
MLKNLLKVMRALENDWIIMLILSYKDPVLRGRWQKGYILLIKVRIL